ncbi:MAG: hypothetical protein QOK39_1054 [Acidimicrobiaceae bacterium]|nr:hypothetical protein [Acidimicrobiaceae bacterium]
MTGSSSATHDLQWNRPILLSPSKLSEGLSAWKGRNPRQRDEPIAPPKRAHVSLRIQWDLTRLSRHFADARCERLPIHPAPSASDSRVLWNAQGMPGTDRSTSWFVSQVLSRP